MELNHQEKQNLKHPAFSALAEKAGLVLGALTILSIVSLPFVSQFEAWGVYPLYFLQWPKLEFIDLLSNDFLVPISNKSGTPQSFIAVRPFAIAVMYAIPLAALLVTYQMQRSLTRKRGVYLFLLGLLFVVDYSAVIAYRPGIAEAFSRMNEIEYSAH